MKRRIEAVVFFLSGGLPLFNPIFVGFCKRKILGEVFRRQIECTTM